MVDQRVNQRSRVKRSCFHSGTSCLQHRMLHIVKIDKKEFVGSHFHQSGPQRIMRSLTTVYGHCAYTMASYPIIFIHVFYFWLADYTQMQMPYHIHCIYAFNKNSLSHTIGSLSGVYGVRRHGQLHIEHWPLSRYDAKQPLSYLILLYVLQHDYLRVYYVHSKRKLRIKFLGLMLDLRN